MLCSATALPLHQTSIWALSWIEDLLKTYGTERGGVRIWLLPSYRLCCIHSRGHMANFMRADLECGYVETKGESLREEEKKRGLCDSSHAAYSTGNEHCPVGSPCSVALSLRLSPPWKNVIKKCWWKVLLCCKSTFTSLDAGRPFSLDRTENNPGVVGCLVFVNFVSFGPKGVMWGRVDLRVCLEKFALVCLEGVQIFRGLLYFRFTPHLLVEKIYVGIRTYYNCKKSNLLRNNRGSISSANSIGSLIIFYSSELLALI